MLMNRVGWGEEGELGLNNLNLVGILLLHPAEPHSREGNLFPVFANRQHECTHRGPGLNKFLQAGGGAA